MSVYNGEKYLNEQIDSVLKQKDVEIRLVIRNDGSKDNTMEILKKISDNDKRIIFYEGENLGPAYSFLNLVSNAGDSDYYAFADQDDIWDEDKLIIAIRELNKMNSSKPILYYSNLKVVESDLSFIRMAHDVPQIQNNKYAALLEYMPSGCTMVFNKKLVELTKIYKPHYCFMHDVWMYVICKMFGETYYDFDGHILYRQHGNNVLGAYKRKSVKVYLDRIKRVFDRNQQPKFKTACCLYEGYKQYMSEEDLQVVNEIVCYKDSIRNLLKLLFDNRLRSSSISRDIRNKLLIIARII